jgi:molybdopterin molybdotransferase
MTNKNPLLPLDDALVQLLAQAKSSQRTERVATIDADGRVLASDLISEIEVPSFDNSAMDGYAVRSADCQTSGAVLAVTQRIAAGSVGQALQAGQAARIFTGAPVPPEADAVVMQELCATPSADQVQINATPAVGLAIRRAGEDVRLGEAVLKAGVRLTPAALGLAASVGASHLMVTRKPRVALLSTGDELIMPGEVAPKDLPPGAIYNSNRFFLKALLTRMGCDVSDLGVVPDDRVATIEALRSASREHDVILTSG